MATPYAMSGTRTVAANSHQKAVITTAVMYDCVAIITSIYLQAYWRTPIIAYTTYTLHERLPFNSPPALRSSEALEVSNKHSGNGGQAKNTQRTARSDKNNSSTATNSVKRFQTESTRPRRARLHDVSARRKFCCCCGGYALADAVANIRESVQYQ